MENFLLNVNELWKNVIKNSYESNRNFMVVLIWPSHWTVF